MLWYAPRGIAHLMEWGSEPWLRAYHRGQGDAPRRGWVSPCRYSVFVPGDQYERLTPTATELPEGRWCAYCESWARVKVMLFIDTGIIAEIPPGTVSWP